MIATVRPNHSAAPKAQVSHFPDSALMPSSGGIPVDTKQKMNSESMITKPLNITKCLKDAQLSKTYENLILSYKKFYLQGGRISQYIWKQTVTSVSI